MLDAEGLTPSCTPTATPIKVCQSMTLCVRVDRLGEKHMHMKIKWQP